MVCRCKGSRLGDLGLGMIYLLPLPIRVSLGIPVFPDGALLRTDAGALSGPVGTERAETWPRVLKCTYSLEAERA